MIARDRLLGTGHAGLAALAFAASFVTLGCSLPVHLTDADPKLPRNAVPVAIQAGIDTLDDPVTQRRIEQLLARPEMRAIQRELVAGSLDATFAALGEKQRSERIRALLTRTAADLVRGATNQALDGALTPKRRRDLEESLQNAVAASVRTAAAGVREAAIGDAVASAMTDEIGPALQQAMRDNLAPALAALLEDEAMQRALGKTARVLGRETLLGATEALAERKAPPEEGSILSHLTRLADRGARLFGSAAWLLVLVIVTLVFWNRRLLAQTKRHRRDAERGALPRETTPPGD